jgi:hypothetical protein
MPDPLSLYFGGLETTDALDNFDSSGFINLDGGSSRPSDVSFTSDTFGMEAVGLSKVLLDSQES